MLDAIAQTLAEQAAKPAAPATVQPPHAPLVAAQQTAVSVPKPTISAPESLSPTFLPQPQREDSAASTAAKPTSNGTNALAPENDPPTAKQSAQSTQPLVTPKETAKIAISQLTEQATAAQRLVLKQRLADLVAKDKTRKEAKLRANLEAMAIASAQAGEFLQARRLAQDQMLSSDKQAALLAQIDAIAGVKVRPKTVQQPPRPQTIASTPVIKPWKTVALSRSLPSVLPYIPSQKSTTASDAPQAAPEYVGYSLNGFGRTIGGFGVVIDSNTTELNGQSWATAYAPGSRFNAELWNGLSFIFPLSVPAPITSAFGWRVHPIRGDRRFHSGTDLGAPMGTPVLAAASGKVALSDWLGGYGLAIILSHQDDTQETLYGHLSQVFVKPGQWVEKGTIIGRVGSTGLSTGPHLHFELRQKTANGWQAIDPGVQLKYALARLVKAMQSG